MRRVLGYVDGRAVWSENQPAEPLPAKGFAGGLVVAPSRPAKGAGLTPTQRKPDARPVETGRPRLPATPKPLTYEQTEARRKSWRESSRRKRQRQLEARAALRSDVAAIRLERAS